MKHFKKFVRDQLVRDQRGVSPVIGVILMVAITVIMGAVVAMFAYGYLGNTPKSPNVALSVIDDEIDSNSLIIKDTGGESIAANDWKCSVTPGKGNITDFTSQTETGALALSTGTNLHVGHITTNGTPAIAAGWYHIVAVHIPSDSILYDANLLVR